MSTEHHPGEPVTVTRPTMPTTSPTLSSTASATARNPNRAVVTIPTPAPLVQRVTLADDYKTAPYASLKASSAYELSA